MAYSITWTLRNIPKSTREKANLLAAVEQKPMADVVTDAINRYYDDVATSVETIAKFRELSRD